jgi:acyl-CoA synthetase (AMP-forming)/AMP-acid ligase II
MDSEGFITLVDRRTDMIITVGENVYPVEVEQVLYRHPAVREVAVVGVPHARWEESYARERLAHFKCPTRVEYVPELPRNTTRRCSRRDCAGVWRPGHGRAVHR